MFQELSQNLAAVISIVLAMMSTSKEKWNPKDVKERMIDMEQILFDKTEKVLKGELQMTG